MTMLLPEEIPGATLKDGVSEEDHPFLSRLKRWLECRGLDQSGTKSQLIIRVQKTIETEGRLYDAKRNFSQPHQPITSHFSWDNVRWGTFPSCSIPIYFNKGHIYTYVIGIHCEHKECEALTSVKPFKKGHQNVSSDLLSKVEDGLYKQVYACKCICLSSFQKTRKYEVGVMINKISGAVISGVCQCKQVSVGKCSHIIALLVFIWDYVKDNGYNTEADASELYKLGLGSLKRNLRKISSRVEGVENAVKKYRPIVRDTFDPRPSGYTRKPDLKKFIADLRKCGGNSLFETIFTTSSED